MTIQVKGLSIIVYHSMFTSDLHKHRSMVIQSRVGWHPRLKFKHKNETTSETAITTDVPVHHDQRYTKRGLTFSSSGVTNKLWAAVWPLEIAAVWLPKMMPARFEQPSRVVTMGLRVLNNNLCIIRTKRSCPRHWLPVAVLWHYLLLFLPITIPLLAKPNHGPPFYGPTMPNRKNFPKLFPNKPLLKPIKILNLSQSTNWIMGRLGWWGGKQNKRSYTRIYKTWQPPQKEES